MNSKETSRHFFGKLTENKPTSRDKIKEKPKKSFFSKLKSVGKKAKSTYLNLQAKKERYEEQKYKKDIKKLKRLKLRDKIEKTRREMKTRQMSRYSGLF